MSEQNVPVHSCSVFLCLCWSTCVCPSLMCHYSKYECVWEQTQIRSHAAYTVKNNVIFYSRARAHTDIHSNISLQVNIDLLVHPRNVCVCVCWPYVTAESHSDKRLQENLYSSDAWQTKMSLTKLPLRSVTGASWWKCYKLNNGYNGKRKSPSSSALVRYLPL